jgi:hypothetical protein
MEGRAGDGEVYSLFLFFISAVKRQISCTKAVVKMVH